MLHYVLSMIYLVKLLFFARTLIYQFRTFGHTYRLIISRDLI